jgi:hypothetical protein
LLRGKGKNLKPVLVGLIRTYVHIYIDTHIRMYIHTFTGKVHPRTVYEGTEGGVDI